MKTKHLTYIFLHTLNTEFKNIHPSPSQPQDAPYPWIRQKYVTTDHLKNPPENSLPMTDRKLNQPQQNCVTFLYCVGKVYLNVCMAIHDLSRRQIDGTEGNEKNNTFLELLHHST